jgi:hypothetical protein
MSEGSGPTLWQAVTALLGLAQAAFLMGVGWLWSRISGAEARTESQIRDVWSAINAERRAAEQSRERMLERLGTMPTKDDFARLETRITEALARRDRGGAD